MEIRNDWNNSPTTEKEENERIVEEFYATVTSAREFIEMMQEEQTQDDSTIWTHLANVRIERKFITPLSPSKGGFPLEGRIL